MAAIAGRLVRVQYNSGSGLADIAGARIDNGTITRGGINVTDKDDGAAQHFLTELGSWAMNLTVSGVLKDDTLMTLAAGTTTFAFNCALEVGSIGTFTGSFGITNFEVGGEDGENPATFSCTFTSNGDITYT